MTKRMKTVEIERTFSISYKYLQELIKDIPKEHRSSIQLEHQEHYYPYESSPSHFIVISYERLETDEEEATREDKEAKDREVWEAREKETFRQLKQKYEGN